MKSFKNHKNKQFLAVLVISAFAGVASLIVSFSSAQVIEPRPDNSIAVGYGIGWTGHSTVDPGKGSIPVYYSLPSDVSPDGGRDNRSRPAQWHVSVRIKMYGTRVTNVVCRAGYSCQTDRVNARYNSTLTPPGYDDDRYMCINLGSQDYGKTFTLLTIQTDPTLANRDGRGFDWNLSGYASHGHCIPTSSLSSNEHDRTWSNYKNDHLQQGGRPTGHSSGGWGPYSGGSAPIPSDPGNPSSGGGDGGTGSGTNGTGSGSGSTGSSGGGGGGSSANRQGDAPNSIPASADQGEAEQPKLEPSPFFDGKDFEKGSDADTLGSTVSATTDKLRQNWYVPLGLLLMGVGVGGYMWNRRRQKP